MQVKQHHIFGGKAAWLLHIPIPDPVAKTYKSTKILPCDAEQFATEMIAEIKTAKGRQDTLSYLFDVFDKLIDFGNRLETTFPYPPEMFTITEDMIISFEMT